MKQSNDRVIFHCDCNGFYASVEEVLHPELRKVPMAVCGDPDSRHGIILAKNELAKGFGVQTAETIWQAKQKCPDLVLAPARHGMYREYCEIVNAIYYKYTDQLERFGIDESFLDVTGSLHLFGGDQLGVAHEIRKRVQRETNLTISVGISYNKIFAKLGSDYKKPNAVTQITRENYREILWPLPASAMLMVGKVTAETLLRMHILTIGDLARCGPTTLRNRLGKLGDMLHIYANGLDDSPVLHADEAPDLQSVGNGLTFKRNLVSREDIMSGITALADSVSSRLRKGGLKASTVQVTIKDANLKVITRQKGLEPPTHLGSDLIKASMELVEASWRIGVPIRMLTISASNLIPADTPVEQLSLFDSEDNMLQRKKREQLEKTVDNIRSKYGSLSIKPGSVVDNELGI